MNITFVYPTDLLGTKIGGVETFIRGFVKFSPRDFNIRFIGITTDKRLRPLFHWSRIELLGRTVEFYPILFGKSENQKSFVPLSLRFVMTLRFCCPKLGKSVLMFNRPEPAVLFKEHKGVKMGFVHNDLFKQIFSSNGESRWSRFSSLYKLFERNLIHSFDYIYTVSQATLDLYRNNYPLLIDKCSFLPTWVDTSIFNPSNLDKLTCKTNVAGEAIRRFINEPWFLFVGRLQEQKAPERLISSFVAFYKRNKTGCLIIVGEGNLRNRLLKLVNEVGLSERVFFISCLSQNRLADFYRAADLLVLTSDFEGMPRCVLEALGCGLPVITTDVGEVRRVVKDDYSGLVSTDFNSENICLGMERILCNPHIFTSINCLVSVKEFTPEIVLKQVYDKIFELWAQQYEKS